MKKTLVGVSASLILLVGGGVGFAAGMGFFDNATIVQNLQQQLANSQSENERKDAKMQELADLSQQKIDEVK